MKVRRLSFGPTLFRVIGASTGIPFTSAAITQPWTREHSRRNIALTSYIER
jgi:hypothetical protein